MVPYVKCISCRIRVSQAGSETELTDGLCPGCGRALEPVASLAELVGFRSPNLHDSSVPARIAARVADISGGRAAAEAALEAQRWLDDGGSLIAAEAALPHPHVP
jgi:hypothetical protein